MVTTQTQWCQKRNVRFKVGGCQFDAFGLDFQQSGASGDAVGSVDSREVPGLALRKVALPAFH